MGETERRNVIIVGAGASQEFGLPTGAELTQILEKNLRFEDDEFDRGTPNGGDKFLRRALSSYASKHGMDPRYLYSLARKISDNMRLAPSIDNFLDTHKENELLVEIGKISIANAILQAERSCKLRIDETNIYNRLHFGGVEETWAAVFFKIIAAKRDYGSFLSALENITFVSFNYDRCIKQFFVNAASSYFDLRKSDVEQVLATIEVIHPYGSIGELGVSSERTRNFGVEAHPEAILQAGERIQTFTEGVSDSVLSKKIQHALDEAEVLIFLGFSFININMEILKVSRGSHTRVRRILATAKGRSKDTKTRLATQLAGQFMHRKTTHNVELFDGKCFELFYEYDHYLMSAQPS